MILVPVDFSLTSINAAKYACQWAIQLGFTKLHLYHSYIADDGVSEIGIEGVAAKAKQALIELKQQLESIANCPELTIETNQEPVLAYLNQLVKSHQAYNIVMGLSGKGKLAQKVIGSTTTKVAQEAHCPVIIVPPDSAFQSVKNIVLALPFQKDRIEKTPANLISNMVLKTGAQLMVLQVNNGLAGVAQEVNSDLQTAHHLFPDIEARFYTEEGKQVPKEVLEFAIEQSAEMIIAIIHQHGFWHKLLKGDTTEEIVFNSKVPIFAARSL